MPYNADLRCGYFKMQFNMGWFYEAMSEMEEEIDFEPTPAEGYEINDENMKKALTELTIKRFEEHIEECLHKYITHKTFILDKDRNKDIEGYDSVWEYLRDCAMDYSNNHPEVKITALYAEEEQE
jgi:hypothetical protein